jgi:hypothetical protein
MNYLVISDHKIILSNQIILNNGAKTFNSFSIPKNSIIKLLDIKSRPNFPKKKKIYKFKVLKSSENYLVNKIGIYWSPFEENGEPKYKNNIIKLNNLELLHFL